MDISTQYHWTPLWERYQRWVLNVGPHDKTDGLQPVCQLPGWALILCIWTICNFHYSQKSASFLRTQTTIELNQLCQVDLGQQTVELQSICIWCPLKLPRMNVTWHYSQDTHLTKMMPHAHYFTANKKPWHIPGIFDVTPICRRICRQYTSNSPKFIGLPLLTV